MHYTVGERVQKVLQDRFHLRTCQKGKYTDICDGELYQNLVRSGFLADNQNVSFIFNTDGIPIFKSSGFSFWPLYLLINELPYKMR